MLTEESSRNRWNLDDLDQALARCRERNRQKIRCTFHVLDEYTQTREAVDSVTAAYRDTIAGITAHNLSASISVKLSSLGTLFDGDLALEQTYDLCRYATRVGVGFEIDMEGRGLVGAAIEAAALCANRGLPVTLAVQAYLERTHGDLRMLLALGIMPRFVKGAYLGDIQGHAEIRKRLLDLVQEAAGYDVGFHVGTHDPDLIRETRSLMEDRRDSVTFGFLMGLADQTKIGMAAEGWKVSEYVPFGKDPGPYVARRERYLRELGQQQQSPVP
jgi:proline dehydrogenase